MENVEKQKLKNNIWKFYLFQILTGLFFATPIIVLFWMDNGLNLTQIMILQSLFSLTVVVLEVPSGYFADIFGRKKSLILSGLFWTLGIFAYSLGYNFYQFLIAEILCALGISLASGTDSAFIYDTLKDLKQEKFYKKIWGNVLFYNLISMAFGSIVGGFIGKINFRWTFYAMLPLIIFLIPITLSLKEPKRHKLIFKKGYLFELLKILKYSLLKNRKIRWLVVYSAIIFGFNNAVLWLYQPYFTLTNLDIFYFGFIFAAFNIVAALTSKYSHKIENKLGQKYSLIMLVILVGVSYLLMGNFIYLFSFSFAFLQQFVRGFSSVVITDYINKLTSSKIRATILSAQNLLGSLFYATIIPFIGWIADVYTLTQALSILGITSLTFGIIILMVIHRTKVM